MVPGLPELGVILILVLILFGAGRLPDVFQSIGQGIKNFRDAQREDPDAPPARIAQDDKAAPAREVEKASSQRDA